MIKSTRSQINENGQKMRSNANKDIWKPTTKKREMPQQRLYLQPIQVSVKFLNKWPQWVRSGLTRNRLYAFVY